MKSPLDLSDAQCRADLKVGPYTDNMARCRVDLKVGPYTHNMAPYGAYSTGG